MKLYALCDQNLLDKKRVSLEKFVDIAKTKNAHFIQYRNKNSDLLFAKQQLIKIRELYDGYLIINDFFELVEYCDGVHVGQDDLKKIDSDVKNAAKILRSIVKKDKIIGISTHNEKEVLEANEMDIDYIGLGAYRSSNTKTDISTILADKLDLIASKSKHPVGAIGGVRFDDNFDYVTYRVIGNGLFE